LATNAFAQNAAVSTLLLRTTALYVANGSGVSWNTAGMGYGDETNVTGSVATTGETSTFGAALTYATTTSSGNQEGFFGTGKWYASRNASWIWRGGFPAAGDYANARDCIGVTDIAQATLLGDTNCAAASAQPGGIFAHDTGGGVSAADWLCVYFTASGTPVVTDSTVSAEVTTEQILAVYQIGSTLNFYINGTQVCSGATTYYTGTAALLFQAGMQTLSAAAIHLNTGSWEVMQN
jgi:hypothetical protein